MTPRTIGPVMLALAIGASAASAQSLDPAAPATATEVTAEGRVVVESAGQSFACALGSGDTALTLTDCAAVAGPAALEDVDWRAAITDAMLDNDCKLSTLSALGEIAEREAREAGMAESEIDAARARLTAEVDEALDRMLWDGSLTVRDGEFALDRCG